MQRIETSTSYGAATLSAILKLTAVVVDAVSILQVAAKLPTGIQEHSGGEENIPDGIFKVKSPTALSATEEIQDPDCLRTEGVEPPL